MSRHLAFRRQPVDPQMAQRHQAMTMPAPTRGWVESENFAFMQPGAAVVLDNWLPTLRGVRLRGGSKRWCELPPAPVISGFEYISGYWQKMFAGQETELYDVTAPDTPVLVKGGQTSGNYSTAQLANAADEWLIAVNDAADPVLRYDGTTWEVLDASLPTPPSNLFTGPGGIPQAPLAYVWKYRNRLFFIEANSMNAWYAGINSVGGELNIIPLSGAATKGGKLLFGASWSIDAGDGIDDKCVFVTDLGECLIFTGSNPGDPNNWRQEGRYQIPPPMGMNAHIAIGGDLLIATVEGIIPVSKAITKTGTELQLSAITQNINRAWRDEAIEKREYHWSLKKWDEFGGLFVAAPGSRANRYWSFAANSVSLAWCRIVGWDVWCWLRLRGDLFFGTRDGLIMQADRGGYDDIDHERKTYVASLVGGWSLFQNHAQTSVWHQARATFASRAAQPFIPQLAACTDYIIKLPTPPPVGPDPGVRDVWDEGLWWGVKPALPIDPTADPPVFGRPEPPAKDTPEWASHAKWDQPASGIVPVRNTQWVSIGATGYSHAPVVQVQVGQQAKPDVELIAIDCTFERAGVNV